MSSDIYLNGITYPSSRKVAFPGKDGKEVVFDLPEDADAGLNPASERPVQNKVIYEAVQEIHRHLTSPYNFKGAVASASALPAASAANANDTYYLIQEQYRVTSNGSRWEQSSMDEADYVDDLGGVRSSARAAQALAVSLGDYDYFAYPGYAAEKIEQKDINTDTGATYTSEKAMMSLLLNGVSHFACDGAYVASDDYYLQLVGYNSTQTSTSETYMGASKVVRGHEIVLPDSRWVAVRFVLRRVDHADITPEEIEAAASSIVLFTRTKKSDCAASGHGLHEIQPYDRTKKLAFSTNSAINTIGNTVTLQGSCLSSGGYNASMRPLIDAVSLEMDGFAVRIHGYSDATGYFNADNYAGASKWGLTGETVLVDPEFVTFRLEVTRYPYTSESISTEELASILENLHLYRSNAYKDTTALKEIERSSGILTMQWRESHRYVNGRTAVIAVTAEPIPVYGGETLGYKKTEAVSVVDIHEYDAEGNHVKVGYAYARKDAYTVQNSTAYLALVYYHPDGEDWTAEDAFDNFAMYRNTVDKVPQVAPIGLHVMPETVGVLNCIKRARQLTDVRWKPAATIPRVALVDGNVYSKSRTYYDDIFRQGEDYIGVPYSQQNYIGNRYSLDALVTSSAVPEGIMCVESHRDNYYAAAYYGTVCTSLVSYALQIPIVRSADYDKIPDLVKQYDLITNGVRHSLSNLKLCDVLVRPTHVAIITDLVYDSYGTLVSIEVSESSMHGSTIVTHDGGPVGGLCRRKMRTVDEFFGWYGEFAIYRYRHLDYIKYRPNPYSPMADEGDPVRYDLLAVMPYGGNKCRYNIDDVSDVTLLIMTSGYSHVRVLRDGEQVGLLPIDGSTLTVPLSATGVYSAYLCTLDSGGEDGSASQPCSWYCFTSSNPCTVSVLDTTCEFTLTMPDNVAMPIAVAFGSGAIYGAGVVPINPDDVTVQKVGASYVYTWQLEAPNSDFSKFQLHYELGEFGGAFRSDYQR